MTSTKEKPNENDLYDRCHADAVDLSRVGLPRLHHELYRKGSSGNGSIRITAAAAAHTYDDLHDDQGRPHHPNRVQQHLKLSDQRGGFGRPNYQTWKNQT